MFTLSLIIMYLFVSPVYVRGLDKVVVSRLLLFLLLHVNICCEYSLETSHRDVSNENYNTFFQSEIRKISSFSG